MITIITGAASGIGEGLALGLSPSRQLVLCDLPEKKAQLDLLADQINGSSRVEATVLTADVSDPDGVAGLLRDARRVGIVDGLVNCAGVTMVKGILETSVADFHLLINVNLLGTQLCITEAARAMKADQVGGSIVAISSINALIGMPSQAVYTAAKAAINSLVASAAYDLGPDGIRVNAIAPGSIRTAGMNPHGGEDQTFVDRIPLRRIGHPEDMVGPVRFLLSDAASYVTGAVLVVDGGLMQLRGE